MRLAVIGGTGLVGASVVELLTERGHDTVVVARSRGIDVTTGEGLDDALEGVDTVVDVTSTSVTDPSEVTGFFDTETSHLLSAEQRAGVGHHVLLSILGLDRVKGNAHYAGKRIQEERVRACSVPWTIVRAAQFFEFAEMVVGWTRDGDRTTVPPLLIQPIAASDVADVLVEVAVGPARGAVLDVAGPEPQDFVDMARRTLDARGTPLRIVPSWHDNPFGEEMAGDMLLPDADAHVRIAPTTFETWLASVEPHDPT